MLVTCKPTSSFCHCLILECTPLLSTVTVHHHHLLTVTKYLNKCVMYVASVFIYVIHVPINHTTNNTWNKNATRAFITKVTDLHHHSPSNRNFTGPHFFVSSTSTGTSITSSTSCRSNSCSTVLSTQPAAGLEAFLRQ